MSKSAIRCTTPRCIEDIVKWGEHYHSVVEGQYFKAPPFMPDAVALCERCGGYTNGTDWKHVCKSCGREVDAGQLNGLFVPHNCAECQTKAIERDKAIGNVCTMCGKTYTQCCC